MKTWASVRSEIRSISQEEKDEIFLAAKLVSQLVDRRNELGISQRDLSERIGVKQSAIARLEKTDVIPRVDTLVKVAKGLGLELRLVHVKQSAIC